MSLLYASKGGLLNIFYYCLVLFLSVFIGYNVKNRYFSGVRDHHEDQQFNSFDQSDDKLNAFHLGFVESEGDYVFPNDEQLFYLFITFSPRDCYSCFKETPFWKELETKLGRQVKVLGIIFDASAQESRYFVKKQKIQIPVLLDSDSIFLTKSDSFSNIITPAKVLVDQGGNVLDISKTTYDDESLQREYLERLTVWTAVDLLVLGQGEK